MLCRLDEFAFAPGVGEPRRSVDTWMDNCVRADAGGLSSHTASINSSADTARPASISKAAST